MVKGFTRGQGNSAKFIPTRNIHRGLSKEQIAHGVEPPISAGNEELIRHKQELEDNNMTFKEFVDSGEYLEDEIRRRSDSKGGHFFDADTMRFFSSRISELMWEDGDDIYFITSEADKGQVQHSGSTRAFTVRKIGADGDIDKVGDFQEHATLNDARHEIQDILEGDEEDSRNKFTLEDYEKNEDINYHMENAVALVDEYGTPEEKKEIREIQKNHEDRGHILSEEMQRREEISGKYYDKLVKESRNKETLGDASDMSRKLSHHFGSADIDSRDSRFIINFGENGYDRITNDKIESFEKQYPNATLDFNPKNRTLTVDGLK